MESLNRQSKYRIIKSPVNQHSLIIFLYVVQFVCPEPIRRSGNIVCCQGKYCMTCKRKKKTKEIGQRSEALVSEPQERTVNGFSYSILFGENVFFFVRFVTQGLCFRGSREAQSYTSFFLAISDFGNFVVWSHHPTKSQNSLRHHVDTCVQTDRVRGCCDITRMCLRDRSPFLSCLVLTISWFGPIMRQNLKTS